MREPTTRAEWQDAVDAAHALLLLDDAKLYGLLTGGPRVDRERCRWTLERGAEQGIRPRIDQLTREIG